MGSVHQPECDPVGRVVQQQQVGLAVAVEVGGGGVVPCLGHVDGPDLGVRLDLGSVHQPDGDAMGRIVEQQQIGLGVAAEVVRRLVCQPDEVVDVQIGLV